MTLLVFFTVLKTKEKMVLYFLHATKSVFNDYRKLAGNYLEILPWIFFFSDLYWKNPQFFITLKDVDITDSSGLCTLIATLTEKEMNNKSTVAIGFDVYKVIM